MSEPTRPRRRGDRPRVALVLSGGGARGAYEAGVLRYIREELAGDLGGQVIFDIVSGTSVGGIHACFVAGMAHMPAQQGRLCGQGERGGNRDHTLELGERNLHLREARVDRHQELQAAVAEDSLRPSGAEQAGIEKSDGVST